LPKVIDTLNPDSEALYLSSSEPMPQLFSLTWKVRENHGIEEVRVVREFC